MLAVLGPPGGGCIAAVRCSSRQNGGERAQTRLLCGARLRAATLGWNRGPSCGEGVHVLSSLVWPVGKGVGDGQDRLNVVPARATDRPADV